jgi:serine/threonine protein kinase
VLDFGLARAGDDTADLDESVRSRPGGTLAVTASGIVIGTPAYMSPEQWRGERAGVQSDQFSFCVALWRALTGEHPFDTSSREALRASAVAGRVRRSRARLPRRLRGVLRRGLARDPRARFSSLDAIVGEIAPRPARPWFTPALSIATAVAALTPSLVIGSVSGAPAPPTATTLEAGPRSTTSREDLARSAVSPDGARVARLTSDAVVVQALEAGDEPRVVLRGALAYHALSWSPDGRRLALVSTVAGSAAPPGVVVIDVATGTVRRLDDNLGALAPRE